MYFRPARRRSEADTQSVIRIDDDPVHLIAQEESSVPPMYPRGFRVSLEVGEPKRAITMLEATVPIRRDASSPADLGWTPAAGVVLMAVG